MATKKDEHDGDFLFLIIPSILATLVLTLPLGLVLLIWMGKAQAYAFLGVIVDYDIRVVLDNHSAHISKETMAYLASRPGRFEYVHTPKHGSWLNLVESAFSKMARSFLRHIRVASLDELKHRILKGIDEMNAHSVRFQWKSFDFQMT